MAGDEGVFLYVCVLSRAAGEAWEGVTALILRLVQEIYFERVLCCEELEQRSY